ncbi:MAG: Periplasmic thiol:disulfide interchange protein DsbA [uncultured Thiotrichaceae bacterium]|uniref:Periplasmic thiol:disulfide interchange protein DsbA n=1 Tax=uncultured Thiotrichaceae bacterium TaxID=298394 RepID=A0A6S6SU88_9GAMM|nr:MAG: Periplasmic thiol:disulfide interchange protein DsbA [uncultured Thiotrichaceae bacterium]
MTKFILPLSLMLFGITGCFSSETQAEANKASTTAPVEKKAYVEGKDYFEIFPEVNTNSAEGKVEVVELFWLGCPHCYHLEPAMERYKASMPDYVEFKQVPAVLNPNWAFHAKAFYTAKFLDPNNEKKLITKMFQELHEKKNPLDTHDKLKKFFADNGISEMQFNNTYNSMAVSTSMSQAASISKASQANSVPSIIINGKFRTSPSVAKGEENLLEIMTSLAEQEKPGAE